MYKRKLLALMLCLALIVGTLSGPAISFADGGGPGGTGAEGAAQTISWTGLDKVNDAEGTHLYLIGQEGADVPSYYQSSPTATSTQGGTITYSSSSEAVTVNADTGELTVKPEVSLGTPITITATASEVTGYKETASTYQLWVKKVRKDTPNVKKFDADSTGKGKITDVSEAMEYSVYTGSPSATYIPCSGTEIPDLEPGVYHIRYKETDTLHHGFRSAVVQISAHGANAHTVTLVNSHLESYQTEYKTGNNVWIEPGQNPGFEFVRWTITPDDTVLYNYFGGAATDLTQRKIIFKMPDADITLTAEWKKEADHKIKWENKNDLFVYFEDESNLPFGGNHPILKSPKAVSNIAGATITYAIKDNQDNGITIDPSTGKINVNIEDFEKKNKNTPKNRITIIATAHAEGVEDATAEHTLTVKINQPAESATFSYFNEWFKIEQPTAPGGKGRVIALFGCQDFEYRRYLGGPDSTPFTDGETVPRIQLPEYENPLQVIDLEPGSYLFRYKETPTVHHAFRSRVVKIEEYVVPNTGSESSSSSDQSDIDEPIDTTSAQESTAANTSAATTEAAPVIDKTDNAVIAKVEAKTVQKGSEITSAVDSKVVKNAIAAAEKAVKEGEKTGVQIEVKTDKNTESMKVALPTEALKAVSESKAENITVKSGLTNVTMDKAVLSSIVKQSEGEITLSVDRAEKKLNDKQKEAVGDAPVYDITLQSGDKRIRSFDGGKLTISIPYELKEGESAEGIVVWYVDENGNIERMETVYDEATKSAVFKTPHLSRYAVTHQAWSNPYRDVSEKDWYFEAVKQVTMRGFMRGEEDSFAPMSNLTRGMFMTVLYRMAGSPAVSGDSTFTDVPADAYYAKAVAWAAEKNIVNGVGDNRFAPDLLVTREQLAVILKNYAAFEKKDMAFEEANADYSEVADWALDAMKWSRSNGILKGNESGDLMPKHIASRAEIASIIMSYLQLNK